MTTDNKPREGSQEWFDAAIAEAQLAELDDLGDFADQFEADNVPLPSKDDADAALLADSAQWIAAAEQGRTQRTATDDGQVQAAARMAAIRASRLRSELAWERAHPNG